MGASSQNHSPQLEFLPNNDVDDYTMAVVYINEEFAKIRDEEKYNSTSSTPLSTPSTPLEQNGLQIRILEIMRKNPHITKKQITQELEITMYVLKIQLAEMNSRGIAKFEGNSKNGRWVIY